VLLESSRGILFQSTMPRSRRVPVWPKAME
jgi:hypothetical protein